LHNPLWTTLISPLSEELDVKSSLIDLSGISVNYNIIVIYFYDVVMDASTLIIDVDSVIKYYSKSTADF